jgi:hypothetical protein
MGLAINISHEQLGLLPNLKTEGQSQRQKMIIQLQS